MYSSSSASSLVNSSDSTKTISTLSSTATVTNLTTGAGWSSSNMNQWGYALGTASGSTWTFQGVGSSSSATVLSTVAAANASATNADTTNIILGSMVDLTQLAGSYSTTLTFALVASPTYTYTLNFDANGGSGAPSTMSSGSTRVSASSYDFKIPPTEPANSDPSFSFLGWSTNPSALTADYVYGDATKDTYTLNGSTYNNVATLYAIYSAPATTFAQAYAAAGKSQTDGYYEMQDMTGSICDDVTTPTNAADTQTAQLIDSRDSKVYWVAKLADGNCWMTQNLDYNLVAGTKLTSANSNVSSDWTIDASTYSTGSSTWNWSSDASESYDPGDVYLVTSGSTDDDTSYNSLSACTTAGNSEAVCQHGHQGNFYNWYAATAGSNAEGMNDGDEAGSSICPAGWRLPYGTQASKSWYYLLSNSISGYGSNAATSQAVRTAPFYIPRAGYFTGSVSNVGSYGYYWSSTAGGYVSAYHLVFYSSSVYPQYYYRARPPRLGADFGHSVRCVSI